MPDRTDDGDALHLVTPGPLPVPAWRWPDRPGVAGCTAHDGVVTIAQTYGTATYVLRGDRNGLFSGQPQTLLKGVYGRLGPGRARPGRASCGSARSTSRAASPSPATTG